MKKIPEQFVQSFVNPKLVEINNAIKENAEKGYIAKSITTSTTEYVRVFYILFEKVEE